MTKDSSWRIIGFPTHDWIFKINCKFTSYSGWTFWKMCLTIHLTKNSPLEIILPHCIVESRVEQGSIIEIILNPFSTWWISMRRNTGAPKGKLHRAQNFFISSIGKVFIQKICLLTLHIAKFVKKLVRWEKKYNALKFRPIIFLYIIWTYCKSFIF